MEPLFLEYPDATELYGEDHEFLFGRDFLVAPVVAETLDPLDIHLPPGDWYDFWTTDVHTNKDKISLHPGLAETPLYVRAGAIIPMQPVVQSTNDKPDGPLELHIYMGQDCRGTLYQDDGHTFAYQKGDFLRVNYACDVSARETSITGKIEKNGYHPWWNSAQLQIYGAATEPKEVHIGDQLTREWRFDNKAHCITLTVPDALKNWNVRLSF
jgi:alpha-glucosidase